MRYLFCTVANPGSLGPSIGIAKNLTHRGHQVAFLSETFAVPWLNKEGLVYIPNVPDRPTGFDARLWYDAAGITFQCAYIADAVRAFRPDVLVGHQLTVGPYIVHEVLGIPLAVIGLAAWMYPTRSGSGLWLLRNESQWRHDQFVARLNNAGGCLGLPPLDLNIKETPVQGDLFLLRSVPELERQIDDLPSRVHLIGAAIESLPVLPSDLDQWLSYPGQYLYVQPGRTFGGPRFLDSIIATFGDASFRVIVDSSNIDGGLPERLPPNFFARPGICESAVLNRVSAVVSTGHSTTVLAALCHGVPMLLFPNGSGTTDIAARCLAANVAIVSDAGSITPTQLRRYVHALCCEQRFRTAAIKMSREFSSYDAPVIAGSLLEELGSTQKPVLRSRVRRHYQPIRSPELGIGAV
jgi:UDP:flavonoid glycosyltransferase YjiC (YdhE family)